MKKKKKALTHIKSHVLSTPFILKNTIFFIVVVVVVFIFIKRDIVGKSACV